MGCIFRTNGNRVLALCIIVVTSSKRTCTSSISIYTHSGCASTSSTGVVTNYCRVLTSLFRCCLPRTFSIVNVIISTYSNGSLSICIIHITKSNRGLTRSVITSTNSCSRATCSFIFITYCCRSVICRCIFSTDCYFTIMTSYIISSILVTYHDRVLAYIIILAITFWISISPNIYMTVASIITCLCLLWRNTTHSTSYSQTSQYAGQNFFLAVIIFCSFRNHYIATFRFAINDFKDFIHRNYEPLSLL